MKRKAFLSTLILSFSGFSAFPASNLIKCHITTNKVCHRCKYRLGKNIYLEKGVKSVEVDELKRNIMISYDASKTSAEKLKKYIISLGFDADELKADINKREILLDCCLSDITICR